jgi:hypothetical protein
LQALQLTEETNGVERFHHSTQFLLPGGSENTREQEALERRSGHIVGSVNLSSLDLFGDQLHRRLKAIDIQPQGAVEFGELLIRMLPSQTAMTHYLPHHHTIFLLHKALVPFLIGASAGEGDLLTVAIGRHLFVDELSPVIGIDPQDGKREQRAGPLQGSEHRLSFPVEQGQTFRPPSSNIGQREGRETTAFLISPTVGDQIDLQEARLGLVPLGECANGNLLLEQRTRFGRRTAARRRVPVGLQQAISGGGAHGEQVLTTLFAQLKIAVLFQRIKKTWQERDQALGANPVEGLPSQHQGLFDLWSIPMMRRITRL